MLLIWSSANEKSLKATVGSVVSQYEVPHRVVPDTSKLPPDLQCGDVVLACGSTSFSVLQGLKLFPRNRAISSCREKAVQFNGALFLLTFDPEIVERDYARLPEIQWDTQLAIRYLTTGSPAPVLGDYRWVESFHELIERVDAKYADTGRPVEVACDLETKALNPYDPEAWIISIFFTVDWAKSDGMYFDRGECPKAPGASSVEVGYWEGVWLQLNWLLTTPKISLRGANFKFDCHWLVQKFAINCTNQKFDTMLVGSLLNENRSNSLKLHAKIMTSIGGYEEGMAKYDMGCVEEIPKDVLLSYAGADTDATYRVAIKMKEDLLRDKRLSNFYVKLLHPSVKVFEKMERSGMLVDKQHYLDFEAELRTDIARLQGEMLSCLPNKLRIKYRDSIDVAIQEGKSPFRPSLLQEFLFSSAGLNLKPRVFTAKAGTPSTAGDHLMMFMDDPVASKFVTAFSEMTAAQKCLNTYVVGFLKHLHPDMRFHPSYFLAVGEYEGRNQASGATSGRTSASFPAVQTVIKRGKWAKKIRKAFIAPKGKSIIQLDYSQGELRIISVVAQEPTMLDAYSRNQDLHAITAAAINNYTLEEYLSLPEEVQDSLRPGAKVSNFGLAYGMGVGGYMEYARTSYGIILTEEEARRNRDGFFEKYSRLFPWHKEYKDFAHKWGHVRSPLGRVRHLPLINSRDNRISSEQERIAVNMPIQSCLSDMMQLAMVHIDREYGEGYGLDMYLMCHDSVAVTCNEDDVTIWAKRLKDIMENLPLARDFGFESPVKFVADAEAGPSLAELKKLKNL